MQQQATTSGKAGEAGAPVLVLEGLCQAYGGDAVLQGVSLSLARGAIGCLLGPSGCGKTTVLRCIAGFETLQAGSIRIAGREVSAAGHLVPPEERQVGMVFQDYALFPHLTVARNIAFGLRGLGRAARQARTAELIDAVGLAGYGERYPHELSGGQQQRVALARALAPAPALLLLDEPFSNLDTELRERLSLEVREIIKRSNTTAILVTHDQHEAFAIADEIGIMRAGQIEQWADAHTLYHRPASRFVADFVGQGVLVPGAMMAPGQVRIELGELSGTLAHQCGPDCGACLAGGPVEVLLRPDDIVHDDAAAVRARVLHKAFRGAEILYTLELASGQKLLALVPSHHDHALDEPIGIRLAVDHVVAFARTDASQ